MSYSVIIRTLNGGGKYARLLKSIGEQSVKPDHVYIIQPHGYTPPAEQLGYEEFIHTCKGMWEQRIFGMEYCYEQPEHSKYILVCDDDVEFPADFVARLIEIADQHGADTLVPIKDSHLPAKTRLIRKILGARTENRTSPYKITIIKNGRFSVNNHLPANVNPSQSGPFQCFLMRTDITPALKLRDEMWLDETPYALPDDQVFFYKVFRLGMNTLACKQPEFTHLDGCSGLSTEQRKKDAQYSQGRNFTIFWHKFIKNQKPTLAFKLSARISFAYFLSINSLVRLVFGLENRNLALYKEYRRGISDGKAWARNQKEQRTDGSRLFQTL